MPPVDRYDPNVDDGTFLICFKDFRKIFKNLHVGMEFSEKKYSGFVVKGFWGIHENSNENLCAGRPVEETPELYASQNP